MLWGFAAISVPIIIHLLNRRQFKRVVWAAMRFLQVSIEQNQRRLRIEDWLLLLLRCLLLAMLALALTRPALRGAGADLFGQARTTSVIIIDNSYSLSQTDGVEDRFAKARKAAEQVLDIMPAGSATALYLASDIVQTPIPEPSYDLNLARKLIREAKLSDRSTDLLPALRLAIETLQGRPWLHKEVYLITDGQAIGWRQIGNIRKLIEDAKKDVKTHIIFVGEHEDHNLGVSGLRLASGLSPVNLPLRFDVQITNYGKDDARDVHVSLHVDDEAAIDEANVDLIPVGESKNISLFAKLRSEGYHSVTAKIPDDHVPADDHRTIVVRAIKNVRVLLVDGDPGREPRESEVFYLRNALQPVPLSEIDEYFIKTKTIIPAELPAMKFDDYDAIMLANVTDFSQATLDGFDQYLRRGGGLIFFPGPNINTTFYNDQLLGRYAFLPAALGKPVGEEGAEDKFFKLQEKNFEHPVVSIWNDPGSGTLGSARFFRAYELIPDTVTNRTDSVAGRPQTILQYTDGVPAVMERTWGEGRVVLFSSTADTSWNDLPVRPAFVPLIHRAVGSLVQRQHEGLNIRVGQKFSQRVNGEWLGHDAAIRKPRQPADAPRDLRHVELINNAPTLQYEDTELSGAYEASISTEPPTILQFATQPDSTESSLDDLSVNQSESLGQVAVVVRGQAVAELKERISTERTGTELWLPIAALAMLLATAETLLAHQFSKAK